MKTIVVGLGVQGHKRKRVASDECVATVDPVNRDANYQRLQDVPLDSYESALVCTPNGEKLELLHYLVSHKKHILVEKPLITPNQATLLELKQFAESQKIALYTAYNHRFDPQIGRIKKQLESQKLGQIYHVKFLYGNGTARDVRNSVWRDQGSGVLEDLGCHLLDLYSYFFNHNPKNFEKVSFHSFENRAIDHAVIQLSCPNQPYPAAIMETSLLHWKNSFKIEILAEKGSLYLNGLCKWGASQLVIHERILPSGRPLEESIGQECPDPTWALEYQHFKKLCETGQNNLLNDLWIQSTLKKLTEGLS